MRNMKLRILALALLSLQFSCSDNNSNSALTGNLELSLSSIEPASGQHYEGWIITNSGPISSGRFNVGIDGSVYSVDVDGNEISTIGTVSSSFFNYEENGETENAFVLTIEPDGDSDPGPSDVHLVAGSFSSGVSVASTQESAAIGANFLASSGTYILATPTTSSTTADDNQGIWFLSAGGPSLNLPTLSTGWIYEGWIVDTLSGVPLSTGLFLTASGVDSDGAGDDAGPDSGPNFPGQDFINPVRVLNDGNHKVVISVEPFPDFDPAPFTLKILDHSIANGQIPGGGNDISLNNTSNELNINVTAALR